MLRVPFICKAAVVASILATVGVAALAAEPSAPAWSLEKGATSPAKLTSFGRLPLTFEKNTGRYDKRVKYLARTGGATVFITQTEMVMVMRGERREARGERQEARAGARTNGWSAEGGGGNGPLTPRGGSLSALSPQRSAVLRMKLLGANAKAVATGLEKQPGIVNYFIGNDPKKWRTRVPTYAKAKLAGVYPGIDVVYYGAEARGERQEERGSSPTMNRRAVETNPAFAGSGANRRRSVSPAQTGDSSPGNGARSLSALGSQLSALEYDFIVKPGADPKRIQLAFEGADRIRVAGGDLILSTPAGDVRMKRPYAYQTIGGKRVQIACDYRLTGRRATLRVARYDVSRALVVDPVLEYSTRLGSYWDDQASGVAVDPSGAVYVAGVTNAWTFPTTPGAYDTTHNGFYNGAGDSFVAKLNPSGSALVYSTFLGGDLSDYGCGIAVDSLGCVYVAGNTVSSDFPTTAGAVDTSLNGDWDAFVTKLNASGSALVYSTFLGGTETDVSCGIAVDSLGRACVAGSTRSADFPTTPRAFDATYSGGEWDAFVAKFEPSGATLVYSTFLGGSANDASGGIALDLGGAAYVTGYTESLDFPCTPTAYDTVCNGYADAFVAKLSVSGSTLVYATYLGGAEYHDMGQAICVDGSGAAHVTGTTYSADFPTTAGAFDRGLSGMCDAFVTELNASGSTLVYSTFVGGRDGDYGYGLAVGSSGSVYVTGMTGSDNFPTTPDALDSTLGGYRDAYVLQLDPTGSGLIYSTLLGGSEHHELAAGLAQGRANTVYITGTTWSGDFPTTPGAFQPSPGRTGFGDAFVTKLNLSFTTAASLVLYRANLHCHTAYSDGGHDENPETTSPGAAFAFARENGLDVLAVTDHGEQTDAGEWGSLMRDAEVETTGGFVGLPGFEWTHTFAFGTTWFPWFPSSEHVTGAGHINVFGANTRVGAYAKDIPAEDVRGDLPHFYTWLSAVASSIDGGPVVAQFNHPTVYDHSDHWSWNGVPMGLPANSKLRESFALMELGSHGLGYEGTANDNGSGDPDKDNEYWFRRALNNGWRVAPTNNGDNHSGDYAFGTSPPVYTGIFAAPLPLGSTAHQRQSHILNALRARRTFASEDRDAQVIMTADAGLAPQPWWMGQAFSLAPGATMTVRVQAQDQSDPIAKVELISIPGETLRVWDNVNGSFFDQSHSLTTTDMGSWPVTPYGEAWVYARVTENDGQLLYSAPVWIQLPEYHSVVTAPPVSGGAFATLRSWLRRITGGRADEPLVGKEVLFRVEGAPVRKAITDSNGEAALLYTVPEGETTLRFTAEFAGDADAGASYGESVLTVDGEPTSLYTLDRVGTIGELTILRGYLTRTSDGAKLDGRTVEFSIDGTAVGSAVTGATGSSGRADLNWVITEGPATRTILAEFAGDAPYLGSSDTATLTAQTHATKMSGVNREGKITAYRILKAWLWKMDNTPVVGKSIAFKLDGTLLGTDNTRSTGLAQIGYTIADGAGAGTRTILAEWAGDGGYLASSCTNTLSVYKATPYIWVMPRSVPQGGVARLYAYFRRLADYQKQAGKTVSFKVDGTWVADVVTLSGAEAGIARYSYTTVEPVGVHTIRCEFAGDAWVDAGYGEATLTIY